jgi:capsular polysaccharide biosynthesis protein
VSASLAVFSTGNYYHWMLEALPRLQLLEDAGIDLQAIDWFIVDGHSNQFVAPSLAAFGIPAGKLRTTHDGQAWQCEKLYVSSMPWDRNPPPRVTAYVRERFLAQVGQGLPKRRIFVSRTPSSRRWVVNESEVDTLLAARGFEKVYLEACSLADQVEMFATAEAIVGVHGASMTNLLFCAPQTKVIELFNPLYANPCYCAIAQQRGLRYSYLLGEGQVVGIGQDPAHYRDDIKISPRDLERLLEQLEL